MDPSTKRAIQATTLIISTTDNDTKLRHAAYEITLPCVFEGDLVPILLDGKINQGMIIINHIFSVSPFGEFAIALPFSTEVWPLRFDLARAAITQGIW
jgi:hypothetical protein